MFKIRQTHEEIFFNPLIQQQIEDQQKLEEETTFVIDEQTGQIIEEKRNVKVEHKLVSPPVTAPTAFIGLKMNKNTKSSFM